MKTIIEVKVDDHNTYTSIDGANIDILTGIVDIIKAMEQSGSDMTRQIAIEYIVRLLREGE